MFVWANIWKVLRIHDDTKRDRRKPKSNTSNHRYAITNEREGNTTFNWKIGGTWAVHLEILRQIQPFFQTSKENAELTDERELAFQNIRKYLMTTPVVTSLSLG